MYVCVCVYSSVDKCEGYIAISLYVCVFNCVSVAFVIVKITNKKKTENKSSCDIVLLLQLQFISCAYMWKRKRMAGMAGMAVCIGVCVCAYVCYCFTMFCYVTAAGDKRKE